MDEWTQFMSVFLRVEFDFMVEYLNIGKVYDWGKEYFRPSRIIDMSRYVIPESTTEVYYPVSKRKKIVNHKGEVIYDSSNDQERKDKK